MRVVSEAIPVQPEGKEAAQQRSHFEEKDNEDLFKTIDKLNTQMASYISSQATKTTTVTEKNDDLTEDWQHIDRQELLAELAKLKAENKRLLDENGRSMLSRLKDMIAGATILTATELGLFYALYHKEIWYVCENYKEFEVLWTTICKLIYGT